MSENNSHSHNGGAPSFSIPEIRSFVPECIRPYILIGFAIIIQFSGGVYLPVSHEMASATALMNEDIQMAGLTGLIGMSLNFIYMFRFKCAFPPKTAFFICGTIIIIANLITMHTTNVPLLVGTCLVAGFFRMQAMFLCMSTIQLWITPKRDMQIWFCWICFIVNSMISLSGLLSVFISSATEWQYVQWCIIGLVLIMLLIIMLIFKNFRTMPRIPFLGIDYLGMLLWGGFAMSILFVCIYGEHYDWWHSKHIWTATFSAITSLGFLLWRSSFIRHPYITISAIKKPIMWLMPLTYLAADLLLAPSHIFEHALMENILGYDSTHIASLNWVSFAGVIFATIIAWKIFGQWKWRYRTMFLIAFGCFSFYLAYFYLMIDYHLPKEYLFLPIFVRSFGYVILAISLLTATTKLPFPFEFFQGITIQNTFSAALASSIGTAIIGHLLKITLLKNSMLISANFDHLNTHISQMPMEMMYGIIQQQSLIVSMKEIYGWLLILSFVFLFFILIREEGLSEPVKLKFPNLNKWRKKMLSKLHQKLAHGLSQRDSLLPHKKQTSSIVKIIIGK